MSWDKSGTNSLKAAAARAFERDNHRDESGTDVEILSHQGGTAGVGCGTRLKAPKPDLSGVPEGWRDGVAGMFTMLSPSNIGAERWGVMIHDTDMFLREWLSQAVALGWTQLDLFGVHSTAPLARIDAMGLVPFLKGKGIRALSAGSALIETRSGAVQTFRRETTCRPEDQVPVWRVK